MTRTTIAAVGAALILSACGTTQTDPAPTTTTTTNPPTTTTTTTTVPEPEPVATADVVVVGDSLAGAGAVQALIEAGVDVLLIPETGYIGGQAAAAAVSSFDDWEGVAADFQSRDVWPYSGMVDAYRTERRGHDTEYGLSMFEGLRDGRGKNYSPQPIEVRDYLAAAIAGVRTLDTEVTDVLVDGFGVYGLETTAGRIETSNVVDATEFQDLYPLTEGIAYVVPACVQNTTWTVSRDEASSLYPAEDALDAVRAAGYPVDAWLDYLSAQFPPDGLSEWPAGGWSDIRVPWGHDFEWAYRETSGGHSTINHHNDSPMTPEAIEDPEARAEALLTAKVRSYVEMWHIRWVLGVTDHGIATDQGFDQVEQAYWSPVIPDDIERHFPPHPYIRQARTLADPVMTWETIHGRDQDTPPEAFEDPGLMLWGYMADSHGCGAGDEGSSYGLYPVDPDVLRSPVPGFWPGMLRGARVDAVVASSLRMQPPEYVGGYRVGEAIATLGE